METGGGVVVPNALTDLDTTVTGAQLNAIQAWYAGIPEPAVSDLNQTISAAYSQSEVQAISDKVDAILGALRAAGILIENLFTVDQTGVTVDSTSVTADDFAA